MGQPSARERDIKAADLFDYGFGQSAGWTAPTLESLDPGELDAAMNDGSRDASHPMLSR